MFEHQSNTYEYTVDTDILLSISEYTIKSISGSRLYTQCLFLSSCVIRFFLRYPLTRSVRFISFIPAFADTIRSNVDTDIIFEIVVVTNADADADSDVDTNTNTSKITNILIYIFTFSLPQSA